MKALFRIVFCGCLLLSASELLGQTVMFVSEYGTGNIKAFDYTNGSPVSLTSGYTPVAASSAGADGMVLGADGRLFVNRGDGTISRRSSDGNSFSLFVTIIGASNMLDLTRNAVELFAAQYGLNTIYRVSLSTASVSTIAGPGGAARFDGVRLGPDGRLYAVDSSDGDIFAYDLSLSSWTTFFSSSLAGDASQIEFGSDGRIFVSRTIGGQARIYSYTLNTPGNYSSGINPSTQTLIGSFGSGTATGIRIGPDNRLYANNFNAGQVWRSDVGINSMETLPFVSGLSDPGSIYFAPIPEPSSGVLITVSGILLISSRRVRRSAA